MYQTPIYEFPPAHTLRSREVNLSPQYAKQKKTNDLSTHTSLVEQGRRIPKTLSLHQSPTLVLGIINGK